MNRRRKVIRIEVDGSPGEHIRQAITRAKVQLELNGMGGCAMLTFNDTVMLVNSRTHVGRKYREWERKHAQRRRLYLKSAEARRVQKRNHEELQAVQSKLDTILSTLCFCKSHREVIGWLKDFTLAVNRCCWLVWDKDEVCAYLESLGYMENDRVGTDVKAWDDADCAWWIVGQVINLLKLEYGPHPMTVHFCERWINGTWRDNA